MDTRRQFIGQCLMDEPLAGHPALARKGCGRDRHGEMRLAPRPRALMPNMAMRFILDLEPGRGKPLGQFAADRVSD